MFVCGRYEVVLWNLFCDRIKRRNCYIAISEVFCIEAHVYIKFCIALDELGVNQNSDLPRFSDSVPNRNLTCTPVHVLPNMEEISAMI